MKINKNPLIWVVVAVFVVVCAVWLFIGGGETIEDTNGPDDLSLAVITDENIINLDLGAVAPVNISEGALTLGDVTVSNAVKFASDDFSGVYEVLYSNFVLPSDVDICLHYLKVNGGNFKMVVLLDDEIVATLEPSDETIEFRLEDVVGTVSLRIAGESADYEFAMSSADYDLFAHP